MEISIHIDDFRIPELGSDFEGLLGVVVLQAAADVAAKAIEAIGNGSKTGRTYKVSKTGQPHVASAPGEAPASDHGNLVHSIQVRQTGTLEAEVTVGAEYGAYLEFGTVKMAPRPFLGPAVDKVKPVFEKRVGKLLDEALGRS